MQFETIEWNRRHKQVYYFADSLPLCKTLLDSGARIIQLRAKKLDDIAFYKLAEEMQTMVRAYPAPATFIVNDRVEIALEIGADGLHIGQDDFDYRQVISKAPPSMTIGVSVGTVAEAIDAQNEGAAYVGAGAVFPTPTKDDADIIGLSELQKIVTATRIPVVAIGGINLDNIDQVLAAGAHYFAVISGVNDAPDIKARITAFEKKIRKNEMGSESSC